jgi:hypothetical protein
MRLHLADHGRRFFVLLLLTPILVGSLLILRQNSALAANPTTISFQGKVVNSDGTNPTNGTYSFIFRLYNTASPTTATACGSDGTCLFEETQGSVTVTNGIFQVELGSGCTGGLVAANSCDKSTAIDFNSSSALYLTLKFNGDAAGFMSPTIHMNTVPYAFNADKLGGLTSAGFIQNTTSPQSTSNFNISGTGVAGTALQAPIIQTAASTDLALQPATGIVALNKASTNNELRVFENAVSPSNYASITATSSDATFKSNSGITKIGNGTGAITINAGTGSAVNITGHAASTWQTDNGGSLAIQGGSTLSLQSTTSSAVTLDSGTVGDIDIGTNSNGKNIFIGNGSGSTAVAVSCGSGTCGFGNNAIDHTTTIGSVTGTSASSLRSGTGGATISSTATSATALTVTDTALTTGTALQLTLGNPQVNANGGVLSTATAINIGSANHNYLSLTNRDLTFGGHINLSSIANIQNTFVYDTSSDLDGGRWTSDERAKSSSWYNETKDHNQTACVVGTDDRCGTNDFPNKALLVVAGGTGANTLYIFDATDNSLWMSFTQNAGATVAMGVNANNTMSSVSALNGSIYVGTNGSAATGAYEINFKADKITRYNGTDAEDYSNTILNRNAAQTTAYTSQGRTGLKLASVTVNDIYPQIVNGKTFFAAANGNGTAANGGISLINETAQTAAYFAAANTNYTSVALTADDNLYGLNSTLAQLDVWYSASGKSGNNNATSTFYDETTSPALWIAAPTFNTSAPDALFVTNGTSDADGQSNTIYASHNAGLSVIKEKVGAESGGSVKYYTNNMISEEVFGDGRAMLPMAGSGTLAASTTITKGTDGDVSVKQADFTTPACGANCPTHTSAVRGTGLSFNGNTTAYLCTGTTGTCANNTNVDVAQGNWSASFWIKTASSATARVLVDKQVTPATSAGYIIQLNASHQLTSTATDGTTAITATSTRTPDDNLWHHIVVTESRTIPGSACNAAGNSCTVTQYIDGVADGTTNNTAQTGSMTNANKLTLMINSASSPASPTTGSMDEFTFSATALSASQVSYIYQVGSRALNNPNHAGSSTVRGVTVAADAANKLNGTAVVKAVNPILSNGLVYIGTTGGVSVVGMDTDSLLDLYSTSINSTDDTGTAYDATNGNAINSVSIGKGFGTGSIVLLGYNNSGAGGVWSEISSTGLVDFLGNSYDPFGTNLTQTNLSVDRVFRVTNQLSTRMDNFSLASTNMPQIYDLLRVDSNGLTLAPGSSLAGTTIMKTTDISGNTNFSIRSMATNFGSLVSGGAFEGKDSYFGEEFNATKNNNCLPTAAAGNAINYYARGDMGNSGSSTACSLTAATDIGAGELSLTTLTAGTTNIGSCGASIPAPAINGFEQINAQSNTGTGAKAVCAETLTGTSTTSSKIYSVSNLPIIAMKVRPTPLASANNAAFVVAGASTADSANGAGNGLPSTGVFFTNCSTYSSTAPTGCSNTTWYAMASSGGAQVGSTQTCSGTMTNVQFAYLRIEVRSATEVHFYADVDTSNGIQEAECGTGITGSLSTSGMTPWLEAAFTTNTFTTTDLNVDYFRSWQDDSVNPTTQTQTADTPALAPNGQPLQTTPPVALDSTGPNAISSFFDFNAATSEDTVFNHDVYVHGTLFADKIQANQIEGLQVFTDKISSLQQKLTAALDPHASAQTTSAAGSVLPTTNSELNLNIPGSLSINGPAQFHGNVFFYKLVTFTEKTLFNNDVTFAAHLTTAGDTPAAKIEPAAGVTQAPADNPSAVLAKVTISGNDNSGTLNINIGDNSTAGNLLTLNFAKPYDKAPQIFLTPANKDAAQFKYYVTSATNGFKIVATDPLPANTNPQFYYWVVQ